MRILPFGCWYSMAAVAAFSVWLAGVISAEPPSDADFTSGGKSPDGWTLVGGHGRWVDRSVLEVTGDGSDSSYWRSGPVTFEPGGLYRFRMRARRPAPGGGSAIAGPAFANRDYGHLAGEWEWCGHVLRVPDGQTESYLRLGQWHADGSIQFDAVTLGSVLPVHCLQRDGRLVLGEGESIRRGQYQFHGTFAGEGSNYHRTLESATAAFNSNRWCFSGGSQVTYRFGLPGCRFTLGRLEVNVNYHTRGACLVEVSRDGADWRPLARQDAVGQVEADLPGDMLPAESLLVRLRSDGPHSSFQVDRVEFTAATDPALPDAAGQTRFLDVDVERPGLALQQAVIEGSPASGRMVLRLTVKNTGSRPVTATLSAGPSVDRASRPTMSAETADLPAGGSATLPLEIPVVQSGRMRVEMELRAAGPDAGLVRAALDVSVPDYYRADYGGLIAGSAAETAVWWCDATQKIPRQRPAPSVAAREASLSAARNDYEAVQIVVRPAKPLRGLTARVSAVGDPAGVPAENVKVLRECYHYVDHPTDATGVRDWWPDALPPLDGEPVAVPAGTNQPLWVLFCVPGDAQAGDHHFELKLSAQNFSATVPITLHVWDFALPERNHVETAFGLSAPMIFRYHQLKSEADKRRVLDLYFQSFAEHRISAYDPTPLDPIGVRFLPKAEPPRAELDFSAGSIPVL